MPKTFSIRLNKRRELLLTLNRLEPRSAYLLLDKLRNIHLPIRRIILDITLNKTTHDETTPVLLANVLSQLQMTQPQLVIKLNTSKSIAFTKVLISSYLIAHWTFNLYCDSKWSHDMCISLSRLERAVDNKPHICRWFNWFGWFDERRFNQLNVRPSPVYTLRKQQINQLLLEHVKKTEPDCTGRLAKMTKRLIQLGADPTYCADAKQMSSSVSAKALEFSRYRDMFVLRSAGVDLSFLKQDLINALCHCVIYKQSEAAKMLLRLGACPTARSSNEKYGHQTPLMLAQQRRCYGLITIMVDPALIQKKELDSVDKWLCCNPPSTRNEIPECGELIIRLLTVKHKTQLSQTNIVNTISTYQRLLTVKHKTQLYRTNIVNTLSTYQTQASQHNQSMNDNNCIHTELGLIFRDLQLEFGYNAWIMSRKKAALGRIFSSATIAHANIIDLIFAYASQDDMNNRVTTKQPWRSTFRRR